MIVRDEAGRLTECLDALAPLAAECCIVDTGSADATPEIAQARADRYTAIPWPGGFAEARNVSLALCTRPWIFVIDADERLGPEACAELLALAAAEPESAWRYQTRTFTRETRQSGFVPAALRGYPGWTPSAKVRLFPNRPAVRFRGAVHELVEPSLAAAGLPVYAARHAVDHFPFDRPAERIREKRERYLALGQRKLEDDPNDPQAHFEYGNQLAELGRCAEAVAAFRNGLALDPGRADMWKDLGAALHLIGRNEEAERALTIAVRTAEDMADAWRNRGVVRAALKRYAEAAADFERAIALDPAWPEGEAYLAEVRRRAGAS